MNRRSALAALAGGFTRLHATEPVRTPVLLELFTSEGCSSCPPADQLLSRLERQPPGRAEVIVLSEHVDYWNHLGWADPFSSSVFTARQHAYSQRFKQESVYTPQAIVNGRAQALGSDRSAVEGLIEDAARTPGATVEVRKLASDPDHEDALRRRVRIQVSSVPRNLKERRWDVVLAVTESGVSSTVVRGENAGRRLAHTGVVRQLLRITELEKPWANSYTADLVVTLASEWNREQLRAVVFVQSPETCAVAGAASCAV